MQSMESINAEFERQNTGQTGSSALSVSDKTLALSRLRNRFVWSMLYASLAAYFGILIIVLGCSDVMYIPVYGEFNLGLLAVVFQFALVIATFWAYCAWAGRVYDPKASELLQSALGQQNGDRHG